MSPVWQMGTHSEVLPHARKRRIPRDMQQLWSVWALGEVLHQKQRKRKEQREREIKKSEVDLGKGKEATRQVRYEEEG